MSVEKRKNGKVYHLRIRVFGEQVMVATPAETKREAVRIEQAILTPAGPETIGHWMFPAVPCARRCSEIEAGKYPRTWQAGTKSSKN